MPIAKKKDVDILDTILEELPKEILEKETHHNYSEYL